MNTTPPTDPAAPPPARLDLAAQHLPCGADVDDLLDQVAAGRTTIHIRHQAECPSCQAALAELATLWSPVADLVSAPIHTPDGLPAAVMRHILSDARSLGFQSSMLLASNDGLPLYARLGYARKYAIEGNPKGHSDIIFVKRLGREDDCRLFG